jgi:hypothetical protein
MRAVTSTPTATRPTTVADRSRHVTVPGGARFDERERTSRRIASWAIVVCIVIAVATVVLCMIAAGWLLDFGSGPDAAFAAGWL